MVEGARLESVCRLNPYRGFESLPLRQLKAGPILLIVNGYSKLLGAFKISTGPCPAPSPPPSTEGGRLFAVDGERWSLSTIHILDEPDFS